MSTDSPQSEAPKEIENTDESSIASLVKTKASEYAYKATILPKQQEMQRLLQTKIPSDQRKFIVLLPEEFQQSDLVKSIQDENVEVYFDGKAAVAQNCPVFTYRMTGWPNCETEQDLLEIVRLMNKFYAVKVIGANVSFDSSDSKQDKKNLSWMTSKATSLFNRKGATGDENAD